MTAPQPATPGSDSVRQQIAEVLRSHQQTRGMRVSMGWTCACGWWSPDQSPVLIIAHQAEHLVPLVDRLRAEAKAEEAQRIYQAVDDECQAAEPPNYEEDDYAAGYLAGLGFAADLIGTPAARAAAYRTNPSSEETHRGE